MAEVKNIVATIESVFKDEGIKQAQASIINFSKIVKNTESEVNTALKEIDELLGKVGKKKINDPILRQEIKDIHDLRDALVFTGKEFKTLDTKQQEAYSKMIASTRNFIKEIDKQTSELDKSENELTNFANTAVKAGDELTELSKLVEKNRKEVEKNRKEVEKYQRNLIDTQKQGNGFDSFLSGISNLAPVLGQYGFAVSNVANRLLEYRKASTEAEKSSTELGGIITALKNPYVALTGAILATIAAPIISYFKNTGDGADELSFKLGNLGGQFEFVKGALAKVGEGIFKLDFDKLKEGLSFLIGREGRERREEAGIIGESVVRLQNFLDDDIREASIKISKQQALKAEIENKFQEIEGKNLREVNEKKILNNVILEKGIEIDKQKLDFANRQLELVKKQQSIASLSNRSLSSQEKEALLAATIEVNNAERSLEANQKSATKRNILLEKQKKAIIDDAKKALVDIGKFVSDSQFELDTFDFFKLPVDDPFGLEKTFRSFAKEGDDFSEKVKEFLKTINLASPEIEIAPEFLIEIDKIKANYEDRLDRVDEIFKEVEIRRKDKQRGITDPTNKNFKIEPIEDGLTRSLRDNLGKEKELKIPLIITPEFDDKSFEGEIPVSFFDKLFKGINEGQQGEAALKTFVEKTRDAVDTFLQAEIDKTNFLISEQEKRVNKINEIAALGNAEQLQLEEERLNRLLEKREAAEKRQQALNAASTISNNAAAAANIIFAITKAAATGNIFLAIAEGLALVGTILAVTAQLRSIQGFEDGTELVSRGTKKGKGKNDDTLAWVDSEERILNRTQNKKLGGISNDELVNRAIRYDDLIRQTKINSTELTIQSKQVITSSDNEAINVLKEQNKLLKINNELISDQIVDVTINGDNYEVRKQKKAKEEKLRSKVSA